MAFRVAAVADMARLNTTAAAERMLKNFFVIVGILPSELSGRGPRMDARMVNPAVPGKFHQQSFYVRSGKGRFQHTNPSRPSRDCPVAQVEQVDANIRLKGN